MSSATGNEFEPMKCESCHVDINSDFEIEEVSGEWRHKACGQPISRECTCYESTVGHQPGCQFWGKVVP